MTLVDASPATIQYVVVRPLFAGGAHRVSGEIVDGTNWRSANKLVEQRYLRLYTRNDTSELVEHDGRLFLGEDALLTYIDMPPLVVVDEPVQLSVEEIHAEAVALMGFLAGQATTISEEN